MRRIVSGADVLIRGGVISDNDPNTNVFVAKRITASSASRVWQSLHHAKAVLQTELAGWGNAFLHDPILDATPPTITSDASVTSGANVNFAHLLKANKPVTWSIAGGPDAASFKMVPDRRAGTLTMTAARSGANRQVIVRATDANGNKADSDNHRRLRRNGNRLSLKMTSTGPSRLRSERRLEVGS